jgi:hypothetical protein
MKGLIAQNSLVKQVEAQIEQRLRAGVRESYMKIVIAGMKFALNGGEKSILAQLKGSENVVEDVVKGAIGLVGVLRRSAKGAMPVDAMIPAAMTLMLEALDYAERAGMLQIDKAVIDEATQLFIETLLPRLGMTPQKLGEMTSRVHQVMQDPEKMAKLHGIGQQPQPGAQ